MGIRRAVAAHGSHGIMPKRHVTSRRSATRRHRSGAARDISAEEWHLLGPVVGARVGLCVVGEAVGFSVGVREGEAVGCLVGTRVGAADAGTGTAAAVGARVGGVVGVRVGAAVGLSVGDVVGAAVGDLVGAADGAEVTIGCRRTTRCSRGMWRRKPGARPCSPEPYAPPSGGAGGRSQKPELCRSVALVAWRCRRARVARSLALG